MLFWGLPTFLASWFQRLAARLHRNNHERFFAILFGIFFTRERRRTVAAWFRAGGIGEGYRRAYDTLGSVGRKAENLALQRKNSFE